MNAKTKNSEVHFGIKIPSDLMDKIKREAARRKRKTGSGSVTILGREALFKFISDIEAA